MASQFRAPIAVYVRAPDRSANTPAWLWPNLLSLDAPAIAVLWQLLFARCLHAPATPAGAAVLFLCTWIVYAGDRILDSLGPPAATETARHRFARAHRRAILPAMAVVSIAVLWLALTRLEADLLRSYLLLVAAVSAYLLVVHAAPAPLRRLWPKEFAVAVFFAAGICLLVWSGGQWLHAETLAFYFGMAAILWINTRGIESWESRRPARHLRALAIALSVLAAIGALALPQKPLAAALALSALLLAVLDTRAHRLSRGAVRVLADAALLTPLLFLPLTIV